MRNDWREGNAMRAAYLNQGINLLVAVMLVPLIVRYLEVNQYVLWAIFTTFGGITLQLETAIQTVAVREIAREYHSGNLVALDAAIRKARAAYAALSAGVLVPLLATGFFYLHEVAGQRLGTSATREWILFASAYAFNYFLGVNNSILLGMDGVTRYNSTTSLSRILNLVFTYLFLRVGLSIMGLCISFALSVLIGCSLMLRSATTRLNLYRNSHRAPAPSGPAPEHFRTSSVVGYTLYTLSAFALYRGGLLVATSTLPKEIVGGYGLTLQATTMLSALALVPLQVWLSRLVRAIASGSQHAMVRELSVTAVAANAVFFVGSLVLLLFGNSLLRLVHSKVFFANNASLLLVCLAFFVELNIVLLVNFLVTRRNYQFVGVYLATSVPGVASVIIAGSMFRVGLVTLVALPLCLQLLVCLPRLLRVTCLDLAISPSTFLIECGKSIFARA